MSEPLRKIDYASPTPPRRADASRMFLLSLPGAIVVATVLGSLIFEDGDSRNFAGPCIVLVLGPVALLCLVPMAFEAARPRGLRELCRATAWSTIIVAGVCGTLWAAIRFNLLR